MTEADPFAAVAMNGATGTAVADPFTPTSEVDDPFATSSEFRGEFIPSPPLEVLQGRTVCMIPRSFDPTAKDPNNPDKTRELYTVDLYVLDGGPLSFYYKQKADAERGREEALVEHKVDVMPFAIPGYWVPQGAIVGKLKQIHKAGRIFIGTPAMAPVQADRNKGKTSADVQAEYKRWVDAGKPGARPRYSWVLLDPTPAQKAVGMAWWATAREGIAPIQPPQ